MSLNIKKSNNHLIAVTIGDIDGIGIRILLKEWINKKIKNIVLITNEKIFLKNIKISITKINIIHNKIIDNYDKNKLNILSYSTKNKYTNKLDSLKKAYKLTKEKKFIGILTLPINKEKINKYVDKKFIDQTTLFSNLDNKKNNNMIFIYNNKFFIPLTIHIELKYVHKFFQDKNLVIKKIENINKTLINDFKIDKPKIIISGINPHAGENNIISKDENKYLKPKIKILQKNNIKIIGPVSGDSMINKLNLKNYDAFIFAFHDQALIPFKLISNYRGVNFTSNLDIIRVSPSHGTAENLVGKNLASSKGILESIKLIKNIHKNRN